MSDADPLDTLLSDSFSFCHPSLLCARVRLYEDRLEMTGWGWSGYYRRRIPLRRILQVDATSRDQLLLWLADGRTLRLRIDDARRWQQAIARQLEDA